MTKTRDYPIAVERHTEYCPRCNGVVTDEDMIRRQPHRYTAWGSLWLRQVLVLVCPHCGYTRAKTLRRKLSDAAR